MKNKRWSYDEENDTINYPNTSLYAFLQDSCERFPNNISYEYFNKKTKYYEFYKLIEDCAKSYKKMGIGYKDVVSICMPNIPEEIICFYALNKIGAIANLIHPLSSVNEVIDFTLKTKSKMLICIDVVYENIKEKLKDVKVIICSAKDSMPCYMKLLYKIKFHPKIKYDKDIISWKDFIKSGYDYNEKIKTYYNGEDIAAILYSGGTTGTSKGILLSNNNINSSVITCLEECYFLTEKDSTLAILPLFHGFGLTLCIHAAITLGAKPILIPRFSAKTFGKLISKNKPTVLIGVPTLYEALLKTKDLEKEDLSYLKLALCGGDMLSSNLKNKVNNFFKEHNSKITIRQGYGLTECVAACCVEPENCSKKGSIGIPFKDIKIKIVKPNTLEELKTNEVGEIVVSGPTVMQGYFENDEETNLVIEKDKDNIKWVHTGDFGYKDEDGFYYFKQRLKRMIVSSGYNVYPAHVEELLNNHEYIYSSCVIGIPHEYKIEVPKAFIILKDGIEFSDEVEDKIKEYCKLNLPKYSLPYEYEFVKEFPVTKIGKIDYQKLKEIKK